MLDREVRELQKSQDTLQRERAQHEETIRKSQEAIRLIDEKLPRVTCAIYVLTGAIPADRLQATNVTVELHDEPAGLLPAGRGCHERIPIDVPPRNFDEPPPAADPISSEKTVEALRGVRNPALTEEEAAGLSPLTKFLVERVLGSDTPLAPSDLVRPAMEAGLLTNDGNRLRSVRMSLMGIRARGIIERIGEGDDERFRAVLPH